MRPGGQRLRFTSAHPNPKGRISLLDSIQNACICPLNEVYTLFFMKIVYKKSYHKKQDTQSQRFIPTSAHHGKRVRSNLWSYIITNIFALLK